MQHQQKRKMVLVRPFGVVYLFPQTLEICDPFGIGVLSPGFWFRDDLMPQFRSLWDWGFLSPVFLVS